MNKKGFLGLFIFLFWVLVVFLALVISGVGKTQGQHTGYITSVEYESNIIWPADLVYFKTDTQSSQEDKYCINKDILTQAKEFAKNRQLVTIEYSNDFFMWKWDCNGGSTIITKIN